MANRTQSYLWCLLLVAILAWFFHECLWQQYTLLPTDLLNQLILPYGADVKHVAVQNHYTMDAIEQDYPWGQFWQQCIQRGELPLWNPLIMGGQPHHATSMAVVFSPFKLFYLWLSTERAFSLGIIAAFLISGLSMFGFLRELERSPFASFVGSCAWMLNSAFLMWYWRLPAAWAFAPLILWLFEASVRRRNMWLALGSGLAMGIGFLGANLQSEFHIAFLCGGYFLVAVWATPADRRRFVWQTAGLITLIGALISMLQWLPTLELMRLDVTGRVNHAGPAAGFKHSLFAWPALITFPFPALAGSLESFDLLKAFNATMQDFTSSIGLVPFALALIGMWTLRNRRGRGLLIIAGLVLVILFLTPLVLFLYHRFLIVFTFILAVFAAFGADTLWEPATQWRRFCTRVLGGVCAIAVLLAVGLVIVQMTIAKHRVDITRAAEQHVMQAAAGTFSGARPDWLLERVGVFLDHYRLANPVFAVPIAGIVLAFVAWQLFQRRRLAPTAFCLVLTAVMICDLTVAGRNIVPQVDLLKYPLYPPITVLSDLPKDTTEPYRVGRWTPRTFLFLPDNMSTVYGINSLGGYESLCPANLRALPGLNNDLLNPSADLAGVRYVMTPDDIILPSPRFELIHHADHVNLFRNPQCLPRAQLFTHWELITDRRALSDPMASPAFAPDKVVFLDQAPPLASMEPAAAGKVTFAQDSASRVELQVAASQPAMLLLADTYYPGWRATLDGQSIPIYRADLVLRAVVVPAGQHQIVFEYRPRSFVISASISLLTIALTILALVGHGFRFW